MEHQKNEYFGKGSFKPVLLLLVVAFFLLSFLGMMIVFIWNNEDIFEIKEQYISHKVKF